MMSNIAIFWIYVFVFWALSLISLILYSAKPNQILVRIGKSRDNFEVGKKFYHSKDFSVYKIDTGIKLSNLEFDFGDYKICAKITTKVKDPEFETIYFKQNLKKEGFYNYVSQLWNTDEEEKVIDMAFCSVDKKYIKKIKDKDCTIDDEKTLTLLFQQELDKYGLEICNISYYFNNDINNKNNPPKYENASPSAPDI